MSVEETLAKRGATHGDFKFNAEFSQLLKQQCRNNSVNALSAVQREALDNICQKIARIVTGNPNHADNWHDIAGYATLAEKELNDEL